MKRFKQHWSARPLSWLLSVAMAWPALIFLMAGGPSAHAQTLQRSSNPQWAVLDFENHSGYGGLEVGRTASDAFVVELGKSNKYDVLGRAETLAGLANTGQTPPLDVIGLQRLGRTLTTNAIATGEVAAVSFSRSPRQATVSVVVRVTDSNTGELVNGALAQGTSNPRAISANDDDTLVNEAINNAAFAAVRQITQFNLPKATVLNNEDQDRVLLNKGTRDGLYDGLDMVVTRSGSEVGRIRVANASQDQSDAVVTRRGLGIQPQDHATAVYQLPTYSVSGGKLTANANDVGTDGAKKSGGKRSVFSGVTGLLIALLAGALFISLIKRGGGSGSVAGATIGKPQALEGRADVIGGAGISPGTDQYPLGFGLPPAPPRPSNYLPITVRITGTVGNIPNQNFIEYHVYRSNFPPILQDSGVLNTVTSGTVTLGLTGFGTVPVLVQPGASPLQIYDDGGDKLGITASKPTIGTGTNNTGGGGGGGGTNNTGGGGGTNNTTGNTIQTISVGSLAGLPGTGILHVGDRFYYLLEGLYQQQVTGLLGGGTNSTGSNNTAGGGGGGGTNNTGGGGGGTNNTGGTNSTGGPTLTTNYYLTGRIQTNYVTYLEPVNLVGGDPTTGAGGSFSTSTSADNFIVSPSSTLSADTYVLELATDPGFGTKRRLSPSTTGPYTGTADNPRAGSPVTWYLQTGSTLGSLRQLYPNATQIYARVGARDSRNGSSEDQNPYIYSDTVAVPSAFTPNGTGIGGPPAVPSARPR